MTLGFAVRTAVFTIHWSDPAHHEQPLAGWMTPRYIARSWHVPPQTVVQALGLAPGRGHPEPLDVLARKAGIPLTRAIAQVRAAIARERAAKGDPARDRASRP